jgi:hypothetical protein
MKKNVDVDVASPDRGIAMLWTQSVCGEENNITRKCHRQLDDACISYGCLFVTSHPSSRKFVILIPCDQVYFYNTFDPRWMWLAGLFSLIGGGDLIFSALLQALIAETIPHSSL